MRTPGSRASARRAAAVRSFDVFDTVLMRTLGGPHAVFAELARRAAASQPLAVPAPVLVAARIRAERGLTAARARPPTLREVWDEVGLALALDPSVPRGWQAIEQDIEIRTCVPVPGIAEVLHRARRDGTHLVFVSDTPYSEAFVSTLLAGAGLLSDTDRVYTSADRGASKSSGELFDVVAADLGVHPDEIAHLGDNEKSDVGIARLHGWRAHGRAVGRLSRYEQRLDDAGAQTGGVGSSLAGAARLARAEAVAHGDDAAVAGVAAGVAAPTLIGYVLWVIGQARRDGLRTLYFVGRDGEVMLDVARPLVARLAPDLNCRYLHGSRQAWQFATLDAAPEGLDDWLDVPRGVTGAAALARVGLEPARVWREHALAAADPARTDRPLRADDRDALIAHLRRPDALEQVRASAREQGRAAAAYLEQEGFDRDGRYGLVDVGWAGRTAAAFDLLLRGSGLPPARHYLIGATERAVERHDLADPPAMTAWLFDRAAQRGVSEQLWGVRTLLEMFCAGTEGRLLRYDATDDGVRPVLARPANDPVLEWGLAAYRRTVVRVAESVAPHLDADAVHVDLSPAVWGVLADFWNAPSAAEASAWGSFPWEDETWPPYSPVAHTITFAGVRAAVRERRPVRPDSSWRAGSAAASAQPWRGLLRASAWQESAAERLRDEVRHWRIRRAARRS